MEFKLVALGAILLLVGLLTYTSIPNIHRTPLLTSQTILGPESIPVPSQGSVEIPRNMTVRLVNQTQLKVNVTITTQTGGLSFLRLQVFPKNETRACSNTQPVSFLLNQDVSNHSLSVPVKISGSYCFVFNNENSRIAKTVSIVASLLTASEEIRVSKDGSVNLAGLGLGAFGFLVVLYGASRKTIIPWE